jgi:hypothetical protein
VRAKTLRLLLRFVSGRIASASSVFRMEVHNIGYGRRAEFRIRSNSQNMRLPQKPNRPEGNLHLVHDEGKKAAEPISAVSDDEQTHLLELADVALHNPQSAATEDLAGDRAKQQHEKIKQELRDAVDRLEQNLDPRTRVAG